MQTTVHVLSVSQHAHKQTHKHTHNIQKHSQNMGSHSDRKQTTNAEPMCFILFHFFGIVFETRQILQNTR